MQDFEEETIGFLIDHPKLLGSNRLILLGKLIRINGHVLQEMLLNDGFLVSMDKGEIELILSHPEVLTQPHCLRFMNYCFRDHLDLCITRFYCIANIAKFYHC